MADRVMRGADAPCWPARCARATSAARPPPPSSPTRSAAPWRPTGRSRRPDRPGRPRARRGRAVPRRQPWRARRRGAGPHRALPRRAADDAALRAVPGARVPALSDPPQDRPHGRARRDRQAARPRGGRVVYASNHRSHIDYLVEPLVLDDAGLRPPIIAAGINLFGGPLGLIHRHVTGAMPIRRNTKDPAYLITLKAYVAELLRTPRPVLLPGRRAQLQRRDQVAEDRACSRACLQAAAAGARHSCRWRSPTTWCSRTTSWPGRR